MLSPNTVFSMNKTGKDSINNAFLKNLLTKTLLLLTRIYNGCLHIGYFPATWRKTIVLTIQKNGQRS